MRRREIGVIIVSCTIVSTFSFLVYHFLFNRAKLDEMQGNLNHKHILSWLKKKAVKGKTKRGEVVALFELPEMVERALNAFAQDLDRPKSDNVLTYQYSLQYRPGGYVVLHFDAITDTLIDWEINEWICGYCSHVLAYDGDWRLEGKLLAGCVGKEKTGTDAIVLPRLRAHGNRLYVKLVNLTPQVECVERAELAAVPLQP